jgi:arabinose-5-phosphate isomerase
MPETKRQSRGTEKEPRRPHPRPRSPGERGDESGDAAFLAEALAAEADAIARVAAGIDESWLKCLDLLEKCDGHVVISGMGKSGLIGQKIAATFTSLGQPAHFLHPAEAVHGDLGKIRRGDIVVLLSYSGETDEIVNLAGILQADKAVTVGISCSRGSSLARLTTAHLSIGNLSEACPLNLAPTASTTAMLAVGDALALALSRRRNFKADDFHKNHPGGMLGAELRPVTEVLRFRVGENLPVVSDSLAVEQALAHTAGDRRSGAVVLVDQNGQLSGIFTDGDLRRLILRDPDGLRLSMRDVMTRHPKRLTVDDLVRDAVRLMRENRLDEIPVVDHQGRPVGLIDVQDLIAMKVVRE